MSDQLPMPFFAAFVLIPLASFLCVAVAHADNGEQLAAARDAVCSIGGRSANPFALMSAKMNLEQRFGLSDAEATSLMWRLIARSRPIGSVHR
jgi:hypothetical protein